MFVLRGVKKVGVVPAESVHAGAGPASSSAELPRQRAADTFERAAEVSAPARPAISGFAEWCRTWGFWVEVLLSVLVGLAAVVTAGAHATEAAVLLGIWALGNFYRGPEITSPLPRRLRVVTKSMLLPLAAAAIAVGFFQVPSAVIPPATLAVVLGAGVSASCGALRWRLQSPIRVLLVGDRVAISQSAARWQEQERVLPVAAVLVEPDLDKAPREIMGIPTVTGLSGTPAITEQYKADLVVVSPGPGFTSSDFRWLARHLEETTASLGVQGVLDSVAPHRITPGYLHGATIHDVRLPRPPRLVRHVKAAADRIAGALLLVLVAPLLLLMAIAIRIETPGKAFFKQARVGYLGRQFTVYKMRTMVDGAEEIKHSLLDDNEYDDVLFKLRHDPRITRVGRILRRTSLDELPQLINVVRGEMSMVGPRPSLPDEVEVMDADTLRRLAVRPGITGLWQVSGRSDLSWQRASELDTYYADNWSLSGDLSIIARTIKAVLSGKGAY